MWRGLTILVMHRWLVQCWRRYYLQKRKSHRPFYLVKQEREVKWVYVRVKKKFLDIKTAFVDLIVENCVYFLGLIENR